VIKYTVTILLLLTLIRFQSFSQTEVLETKIDLQCTDMSILNIINKISSEYNIRFSFGSLNDLQKQKSLYFKNAKLKFVLTRLFENTDIRFMSFSDHIILVENTKISSKKYIIGYIVDDENDDPIPFATVMFLNSGKGIISDQNGKFELEVKQSEKDTVKFTSLAYQPYYVTSDQLLDKSVVKIRLKKKLFPIKEININAKDYAKGTLGNKGIIGIGTLYLDTHGQEVALYIENRKHKNALLLNISFKLSKKGNTQAPFRIRIYECTSQGKPGKDILKDLLVVKPDTLSSWYNADISDYKIIIPENGLFISMGGIFPDDWYYYSGNADFQDLSPDHIPKDTEDLSYGQRVCFNNFGINKTWHYSLSKQWFQLDKERFNVMIKTEISYKKTRK
jgi:hypothetical protein